VKVTQKAAVEHTGVHGKKRSRDPGFLKGLRSDVVADPRDAAILSSLAWSSATPGDYFDKLLAPGEASVERVTYWEIGNEPDIGEAMVREGLAINLSGFGEGRYADAESEARAARRGIWRGSFEPPADWRKQHPRTAE
jgi:hypothetical protein